MYFAYAKSPSPGMVGGFLVLNHKIPDKCGDFLVRVFVNIIKQPNLVITVYRTSKIEKYWTDEN